MKIKKILIISAIILVIFVGINLLWAETGIYDYAGERILYLISPLGESEYNDLGVVDLNGINTDFWGLMPITLKIAMSRVLMKRGLRMVR